MKPTPRKWADVPDGDKRLVIACIADERKHWFEKNLRRAFRLAMWELRAVGKRSAKRGTR